MRERSRVFHTSWISLDMMCVYTWLGGESYLNIKTTQAVQFSHNASRHHRKGSALGISTVKTTALTAITTILRVKKIFYWGHGSCVSLLVPDLFLKKTSPVFVYWGIKSTCLTSSGSPSSSQSAVKFNINTTKNFQSSSYFWNMIIKD